MDRAEKRQLVSELHESFKAAGSVVVTHYKGLSVAEITKLRNDLRTAGASLKVTKNSLTRLALKDTKYEGLVEHFTGPTAIALSEDAVAAAKGVVDFSNDNDKLVILGGALNDEALDVSAVKALAKLQHAVKNRPVFDNYSSVVKNEENIPCVSLNPATTPFSPWTSSWPSQIVVCFFCFL